MHTVYFLKGLLSCFVPLAPVFLHAWASGFLLSCIYTLSAGFFPVYVIKATLKATEKAIKATILKLLEQEP